MSVHRALQPVPILLIALALFLGACANTSMRTSSISITATPPAQDRAPTEFELAHPTMTPDLANPPVPLEALGPETESQIGGGSNSPRRALPAETDTPVAPIDAPVQSAAAPTGQPTTAQVAPARPTVAPSPTPKPTAQPPVTYTVRRGDTLTDIAARAGVSLATIQQMNKITNPNQLNEGQVLIIKYGVAPSAAASSGPADRIVPDSEAVYSPSYEDFDTKAFAKKYGGYLTRYQENVEGTMMTGPEIVDLVASRFSVGPRVLLTILEMEGGWVSGNPPTTAALYYPMGLGAPSWSGLYRQLWYAADKLNEGYYGKVYATESILAFTDGSRIAFPSKTNAGTAAVENYFAYISNYTNWKQLVGPNGFTATYLKLFGDPFAHAIEPLVPANLKQPALHLPWEQGRTWWFTGGPHGGWADGSAWAAVDFAPEQNSGTCIPSTEYSTAAASGVIVVNENGRILENISGKNFQGSGWTLMYMHQANAVSVGTKRVTGDRIGRPSCQGGYSTADHLHFARLYNGQWIAAADRKIPLVMSGWKMQGAGSQYDGSMVRGEEYLEAFNGHSRRLNAIDSDDGPSLTGSDSNSQVNANSGDADDDGDEQTSTSALDAAQALTSNANAPSQLAGTSGVRLTGSNQP